MKLNKLHVAAVAAVAVCLAGFGATSASADPTPLTDDLVGVGSDTTQLSVNAVGDGYRSGANWLSGYNAGTTKRLVSWDAINPITGAKGDLIRLRVNTNPIARPDGSGAGKNALHAGTNNPAVSFARSSSALSSGEASDGLVAFPFAVDEVAVAVDGGSSYAPTRLSCQQLLGIYTGAITNWSAVGGANAPITALLPQGNSGTRTFFLGQLANCNGGVTPTPHSSVISDPIQEHDASVFDTYSNALVPFSVGRAGLLPAGTVQFANAAGNASDGNPSFDAKRGVYNVVRGADRDAAWVEGLFGESGYFCSFAATEAIAAGGLAQLAPVDFDGTCGEEYDTTTGVTNFLTVADLFG